MSNEGRVRHYRACVSIGVCRAVCALWRADAAGNEDEIALSRSNYIVWERHAVISWVMLCGSVCFFCDLSFVDVIGFYLRWLWS